jgi:benzylsuccinate CoA-transferase BbsF subunit
VSWADIVVESYTPGTMAQWGMGYEDLKKIKPDIIMLSTCMYGQTGPLAELPGFGLTLTGASGISHLAGWPDRPPLPSGAYTDFVVPKFNVLAIVSALDYRHRTGKGQYIDASQFEAALHFVSPVLLEYTGNGRELERIGNKSTYTAPHGVYSCKGENRWCAIAVTGDHEWERFCEVIGQKEWREDARFATMLARLENAEILDALIEGWTKDRTAEEVMDLMQDAGISAGVVQNGEQLDRDPQLGMCLTAACLLRCQKPPTKSRGAPPGWGSTPTMSAQRS